MSAITKDVTRVTQTTGTLPEYLISLLQFRFHCLYFALWYIFRFNGLVIYSHTHTYPYTQTRTHTYPYTHTHVYAHTYPYTHTHTYSHINTTHIHIHIHTYPYSHRHTNTYPYTHAHIGYNISVFSCLYVRASGPLLL